MRERIGKIKAFLERNDRMLGFSAMALGFTIDNLTLTRIDQWLDNIILLSYLTLAGTCILLINIFPNRFFTTWLPLILQYAFGGLFSGYIVFYSRSASLLASWPFLLMLGVILFGNEFFRQRYKRTAFQLSIYFIALFSFSIFYTPILVNEISDQVFILSGVISLIIMWTLLRFLTIVTQGIKNSIYITRIATLFIFAFFNFLYFTNVIPPIPLSLKKFEIYYDLKRNGADYVVQEADLPWYAIRERSVYYYTPGDTLYAFASVFAPTDISLTIIHEWSFFDEASATWKVRSTVPYSIVGGRDDGYRGYSAQPILAYGRWKITITNERGQVLGVKRFTVEEGPKPALKQHTE